MCISRTGESSRHGCNTIWLPANYAVGILLALATVTTAIAVSPPQSQPSATAPVIEPDPELYPLLKDIIAHPAKMLDPAVLKRLYSYRDNTAEPEGESKEHKFVQQLVYINAYATDVPEAIVPSLLARRLGYTSEEVVPALVPYLETPDAKVAKTIRGWLAGSELDRDDPDVPPYFEIYDGLVWPALYDRKDPPHALVRYLYERHPGAALLYLFNAAADAQRRPLPAPDEFRKQRKTVLFTEHIIEDVLWRKRHDFPVPESLRQDAADGLEHLSRFTLWPARLYVAEIMRQYPEFRDEKLIERLVKDEHPLVRESIARFADHASGG